MKERGVVGGGLTHSSPPWPAVVPGLRPRLAAINGHKSWGQLVHGQRGLFVQHETHYNMRESKQLVQSSDIEVWDAGHGDVGRGGGALQGIESATNRL